MRTIGLPPQPFLYEREDNPAGNASLVGLIGALLLIFVASTVSHQLTPVLIVLSVGTLVFARRCTLRTLPILMSVILTAYVSYLTVPYWSGHLHDIFGSFGNVGGTVRNGAVDRVRGDQGHQIVALVRLLLAPAVWSLAAVGAWRWMRRGCADVGVLALAGAPFGMLALQSYGGEVFLRVYLFALPVMVVLLAVLLVPAWPPRHRTGTAIMAGMLTVALTGTFFVARYGNEIFEQVRPADVQAVDWLYSHAPPGASFVALTSNVPWRSQDVERYEYQPLGEDLGPTAVPSIEAAMLHNPRGAFLILTQGEYVFAESFLGEPPGWGRNIERQIVASGHFRLVYADSDARIYVLAGASGAAGGIHSSTVDRPSG